MIEIHGCGARGYADNGCERSSCRGQEKMEEEDSLGRLLDKSLVKPKEEEEDKRLVYEQMRWRIQ